MRTLMAIVLLAFVVGCETPQAIIDSHRIEGALFQSVAASLQKVYDDSPPGPPAYEEARAALKAKLRERIDQYDALSTYVGAYLSVPGCEERLERLAAKIEEILAHVRTGSSP